MVRRFLISQTRKTSLIISHDTGFLDRVTTNIIHYEDNRKLKNYKGNLELFVKEFLKQKLIMNYQMIIYHLLFQHLVY